jgi:uncharacterized protein
MTAITKPRIWIDADACPATIKAILFRAAERTRTQLILVANQPMTTPPSPYISKVQVLKGFDVADGWIVQHMQAGDLVITADVPLADLVITKGGNALNPRGEFYTESNIKQRLSTRNFNQTLRDSGLITGGPDKLSQKEIRAFANQLDKFLSMKMR